MQNNLAFIFPGQGSQAVAMLSDFSDNEIVQSTFVEASAALGYDLWELISQGPVEKLNQTNFTQPALLTASVALWRLWVAEADVKPAMIAGHSLGEYSALVCAGVLSLSDGVKLVEERGEFMQASVPEGVGAMAAVIGLADDKIIDACQQAAEQHSPALIANYTYDLVKEFNSFYQNVSILGAEIDEEKIFSVQLSEAVANTIKSAFKLLGINVPERM